MNHDKKNAPLAQPSEMPTKLEPTPERAAQEKQKQEEAAPKK